MTLQEKIPATDDSRERIDNTVFDETSDKAKGVLKETTATMTSNNSLAVELLRKIEVYPDYQEDVNAMLKKIDASGGKIPRKKFEIFLDNILQKIDESDAILNYFKENCPYMIENAIPGEDPLYLLNRMIKEKPQEVILFYLSHMGQMVEREIIDEWNGFAFNFK